jgi:hypothetical protein
MPRHAASLSDIIAGSKSASFRRINAHLFGPAAPVGQLPGAVAKPSRLDASPGSHGGEAEGQAGIRGRDRARTRNGARAHGRTGPRVRVHLCSYRKPGRPLDDDNLRGGCKHLRDAVAGWLGLDDAEQFVAWEYSQCETRGALGVAVRIELLA